MRFMKQQSNLDGGKVGEVGMKILQSWKRNTPSTLSGESITVTIQYSSLDKKEIDDLEEAMPKGMLVMEVKPGTMEWLKNG